MNWRVLICIFKGHVWQEIQGTKFWVRMRCTRCDKVEMWELAGVGGREP